MSPMMYFEVGNLPYRMNVIYL